MKQIRQLRLTLCFLGITLLSVICWGQVPEPLSGTARVSSENQKKKPLLEEFTGWGCGNCPSAALLIDQIHHTLGSENFFAIAYHAGHYAEVAEGSDRLADLRTEHGDTLHNNVQISGYPCGMLNRHRYVEDDDMAMSRNYWIKTIKTIMGEDAPVNLYVQAEADYNTRTLNVHVEYRYTAAMQGENNFLHVALVEDRIEGYQNQAPEGYLHNHVFRGYLTGQWGIALENPQIGQAYEWNYTACLPDSMGNRAIDLRHLSLAAFITQEKWETQNAAFCKVSLLNFTEAVSVELEADDLGGNTYAYNRFPFRLRNLHNDTLHSLSFSATINGSTQQIDLKDISLPPYEDNWFFLPVEEYEVLDNNTATLSLQGVNGRELPAEISINYSFKGPLDCSSHTFYIELHTDLCADEITFSVKGRKGETLHNIGPWEPDSALSISDTVTLKDLGIYAFDFADSWNDGWKNKALGTQTGYKVKDVNGKLIGQNYSVEGSGDLIFIRITEALSTEKPEQSRAECRLKVVSQAENIHILNPDNERIRGVEIYGIDGKILYSNRFGVNSDLWIPFSAKANNLLLIKIETDCRTRVFKVLHP